MIRTKAVKEVKKYQKNNLLAFFLYSASSRQKYFLGKFGHVLQIAVILENLYSKTPAISLFPGIE